MTKSKSDRAKLEGIKEELGLLKQTKTTAQERVDVEKLYSIIVDKVNIAKYLA